MRLSEEGRLTELPDVGDTIAAKVTELRETGTLTALEKLEAKYPPGLVDIMRLPGVGAKTTRQAVRRARRHHHRRAAGGVRGRSGCATGRARREGRGEDPGRASPPAAAPRKGAILLDRALGRRGGAAGRPREHPACVAASEAGSLRRRRETVGDIDLIAASDEPPALLRRSRAPAVAEVTARGDTKASIVTHDGIQVDLRVVPPDVYGNLLQHFTGSKAHNVAMREEAVRAACRSPSGASTTSRAASCTGWPRRTRCTRSSATRRSRPSSARTAASCELARNGRVPELVELG